MEYDKLSFFVCHDPKTNTNKSKIARVAIYTHLHALPYLITYSGKLETPRVIRESTIILAGYLTNPILDR